MKEIRIELNGLSLPGNLAVMSKRVFTLQAGFAFCVAAIITVGCSGESATNAAKPTPDKTAAGGQDAVGLKELKVEVIKPGTGKGAVAGDLLTMKYTGKLLNGNVFDSNDKPDGNPFGFALGAGAVIEGWDKGLLGAKVGSKLKLSIPYKLGYGEKGSGEKIPPKSDLYFDVEVLSVIGKGEEDVVQFKDLKVGTGAVAKTGSTVKIDYEGTLLTGKVFNSFKDLQIVLGKSKFRVKGLEEAMKGMQAGGEREIIVPPAVGYGPSGQGVVPPSSILKFKVKMLSVK